MAIMLHLQDTIKSGIQGTAQGSTSLPDTLVIPVSDFHLGKCTGTRLRQCLDDLCGMETHKLALPGHDHAFLIEDYSFPLYTHDVVIYLTPKIARLLTNTRNGYFSYSHSLALSLTSKYTLRLYWLISSWRNRGGFVMKVDELRSILCLGTAYRRFDNIAARILNPAQNELHVRFPIWFLYKYCPGDEPRLAFKIRFRYSPVEEKRLRADTYDTIFHLLAAAGMAPSLPAVEPVFATLDPADFKPFLHHLTKVLAHIRTHPVTSPSAYLKASLSAWLADWTLQFPDDP